MGNWTACTMTCALACCAAAVPRAGLAVTLRPTTAHAPTTADGLASRAWEPAREEARLSDWLRALMGVEEDAGQPEGRDAVPWEPGDVLERVEDWARVARTVSGAGAAHAQSESPLVLPAPLAFDAADEGPPAAGLDEDMGIAKARARYLARRALSMHGAETTEGPAREPLFRPLPLWVGVPVLVAGVGLMVAILSLRRHDKRDE